VRAVGILQDAFATDARPAIREWRQAHQLPADPQQAFRDSGYLERITAERGSRTAGVSSYA
jgi:L-rhamnose isomerase/sugar isomerase